MEDIKKILIGITILMAAIFCITMLVVIPVALASELIKFLFPNFLS